jgi:hypothetical protein
VYYSQLGEIIEKTLARMRCPHVIRSHQIRGLDFINIHPVIQWLVKKVLEVRKEVRCLWKDWEPVTNCRSTLDG